MTLKRSGVSSLVKAVPSMPELPTRMTVGFGMGWKVSVLRRPGVSPDNGSYEFYLNFARSSIDGEAIKVNSRGSPRSGTHESRSYGHSHHEVVQASCLLHLHHSVVSFRGPFVP